jgi:hypothetical protein
MYFWIPNWDITDEVKNILLVHELMIKQLFVFSLVLSFEQFNSSDFFQNVILDWFLRIFLKVIILTDLLYH